jgi:Holliday junction resolvasome RuvABC endonuclease subunit
LIAIGLDSASNRWHAVTDTGAIGYCSELKGKAWACPVPKPQKPKKLGRGATKELRAEHRALMEEYQPLNDLYLRAMADSKNRQRNELTRTFEDWFFRLIVGEQFVSMYCEEPLALQNGQTTRLLSLAAGALYDRAHHVADALNVNLTWHWIDVAYWKRVVIGNGNADKKAIADHVTIEILQRDPRIREADKLLYEDEPDLYDARAILQLGLQHLSSGSFPVTLAS